MGFHVLIYKEELYILYNISCHSNSHKIEFLFQAVDSELEKGVNALVDRDGWITKQNFMKFAFSTHLCKDDPQELVH